MSYLPPPPPLAMSAVASYQPLVVAPHARPNDCKLSETVSSKAGSDWQQPLQSRPSEPDGGLRLGADVQVQHVECRRSPKPAVQRSQGRLSALPLNRSLIRESTRWRSPVATTVSQRQLSTDSLQQLPTGCCLSLLQMSDVEPVIRLPAEPGCRAPRRCLPSAPRSWFPRYTAG